MPTRRKFLIGAGVGLVGLAGAGYVARAKLAALRRGVAMRGFPDVPARPGQPLPAAPGRSRIVQVHHARALSERERPDGRAVQEMLDRALLRAYDVERADVAWKALFPDPAEVVGIKVNAAGGRGGPSTSPELVRAVVNGLGRVGIPLANVLVFDRDFREMTAAGFSMSPDGPGVRVIATNQLFRGTQFSPQVHSVIGQPVRLVHQVRLCSAIVNLCVPKHHGESGYTGALKNWYGVIESPQRFHELMFERGTIGDIAALEPLRTRARLTVAEALRSQAERGPHTAREWQFTPRLLFVGTDQVALDAAGVRLIEDERRRRGLPSLAESGREPRYVAVAAGRGLGVSDPQAIEHLTDEV